MQSHTNRLKEFLVELFDDWAEHSVPENPDMVHLHELHVQNRFNTMKKLCQNCGIDTKDLDFCSRECQDDLCINMRIQDLPTDIFL